MAKLNFKYGTMGSSKTAQALMEKYNYEQQGFKVFLAKPSKDNRDDHDGKFVIKSRIGLESEANLIFEKTNVLEMDDFSKYEAVIVDEAQFLTIAQVEQLREIVDMYSVTVTCYGLKTDFQTYLFEGSKRLIEIADSTYELKTVCKCGKKAVVNARIHDGKIIKDGNLILIGGDDDYRAMCFDCWKEEKL